MNSESVLYAVGFGLIVVVLVIIASTYFSEYLFNGDGIDEIDEDDDELNVVTSYTQQPGSTISNPLYQPQTPATDIVDTIGTAAAVVTALDYISNIELPPVPDNSGPTETIVDSSPADSGSYTDTSGTDNVDTDTSNTDISTN